MRDFDIEVELDFTNPFPEDIVKLFRLLINGNMSSDISCIFRYVMNDWNYFLDLDGNNKKMKVTKYAYSEQEKLRNLIKECKDKYQNFVELEYDEDYFANIGNQLMVYETEEELKIRIVPYGIIYDEKVFLHTGSAAYYFIYNKKTRDIKITYCKRYDIESAKEEFDDLCFEYCECKRDFSYIESMNFEGDYELNSNSIKSLYDILKRFEPHLYYNGTTDIINAIFEIKKQIQYPIYSNEEALNHINDLKETKPEDLIELGYHPECYSIKKCFGIDSLINDTIRLKDIKTLVAWYKVTKGSVIEQTIHYYQGVHEIKIKLTDKYAFLELFSLSNAEPKDIVRYVLSGSVAENMDLPKVLKNTKLLYQDGNIRSWKGRYRQQLVQKNNMRSYTKLSKEVLDNIEKKPTLDNLYKQLFST
ncbi:hypothetical protein [Hungatella hathewayi]|uniref:hypothetical protein n=1 Tax=Hungatella hathewayi TaxID=154046 RepID=UPI0035649400